MLRRTFISLITAVPFAAFLKKSYPERYRWWIRGVRERRMGSCGTCSSMTCVAGCYYKSCQDVSEFWN